MQKSSGRVLNSSNKLAQGSDKQRMMQVQTLPHFQNAQDNMNAQMMNKGGKNTQVKQYLDMNQKWSMSPKGTPMNMNFPVSEQKPPSTKLDPQMIAANQRTMTMYNQEMISEADQRKLQGQFNVQGDYLKNMNGVVGSR